MLLITVTQLEVTRAASANRIASVQKKFGDPVGSSTNTGSLYYRTTRQSLSPVFSGAAMGCSQAGTFPSMRSAMSPSGALLAASAEFLRHRADRDIVDAALVDDRLRLRRRAVRRVDGVEDRLAVAVIGAADHVVRRKLQHCRAIEERRETRPRGTAAKSSALAGSKQFFCASVSPFTSSSGGFGALARLDAAVGDIGEHVDGAEADRGGR